MRRWIRRLGILMLCLVVLACVAGIAGFMALRASLPRLDGELAMSGLSEGVEIDRDATGMVTVRAAGRLDAARAQGFLHGQERFFQMDLLRRRGAGELAALFGPSLVGHDLEVRRHGMRRAARLGFEALAPAHREILEAYTGGVNAGLAALRVRPPEYLLLRARPEPWLAEDSLLVGYAMFFTLQDSEGREDRRAELVRRALPPAIAAWFRPLGTGWDAALDGTEVPVPAIPGAEVLDLRAGGVAEAERDVAPGDGFRPGSSSWGVTGDRTVTGAAMVANDMHLDLGMPNIWYRAHLVWRTAEGGQREMVGVTLPGVPGVIVGSNRRVAWAFTNAALDTSDLVLLEIDPDDPRRYRVPEGWREFEVIRETLAVAGEAPRAVEYRRTIWGPVLDAEGGLGPVALRWVAHDPGALNLTMLDLEGVETVAEVLDLAPHCGNPVQNILVADREGRLAWTLMGRLLRRDGFDGALPVPWTLVARGGSGWVDPARYPRWVAGRGEAQWTANNRMLGTPEYMDLGTWETDVGARARQIRDGLVALRSPVREADLFEIYHDDRALFLERWQELAVKAARTGGGMVDGARAEEALRILRNWGGKASVDSVGYRLVRRFRHEVMHRVLAPFVTRAQDAAGPEARLQLRWSERQEGAVWALLQARPEHLLNPKYPSFEALLGDALWTVLREWEDRPGGLAGATWGDANTVRIQHPLSLGVPALGRWLDAPARGLPGDDHMPRIQGVRFGVSERMVVSPGQEERGVFNMPGGQSGHFLSPFYRAGHEAWEEARPTPLLAGPAAHRMRLTPARHGR